MAQHDPTGQPRAFGELAGAANIRGGWYYSRRSPPGDPARHGRQGVGGSECFHAAEPEYQVQPAPPPPLIERSRPGHHEVCLAREKAWKEARQPHSEARVAPGSRCPDLIFHCSCSLKIWETRSAGLGHRGTECLQQLTPGLSLCSPSSASGLHATCGWGIQ